MVITPDVQARFWQKVNRSGACWEWTAACSGNGYGAFKIRGQQWGAHQVSYLLHHGPIVRGMVVMHTCDNPRCVNPDHLKLGTYSDNSQDRDRKFRRRRTSADHVGEANPKARITEAQAIEIIGMIRDGVPRREIASLYGVKRSLISDIRSGRTWRHIVR